LVKKLMVFLLLKMLENPLVKVLGSDMEEGL